MQHPKEEAVLPQGVEGQGNSTERWKMSFLVLKAVSHMRLDIRDIKYPCSNEKRFYRLCLKVTLVRIEEYD